MTTITIPKEIKKSKELVAVPLKSYEKFLVWQKELNSIKISKLTASERVALGMGRKDFKKGNYITWEKLKNELANRSRPKSKKGNR